MARKILIILCSGIVITEVIWFLYKAVKGPQRKFKKLKFSDLRPSIIYRSIKQTIKCKLSRRIFEVMFFSSDSAWCRSHFSSKEACTRPNCAADYLRRIIDYIKSATVTLDVCMYFFTCRNLAKAIVDARKRGVIVRIIIDESMAQNDRSQSSYFYKEGVKLKVKRLDSLMHHKFVVIDNNILITGSMNWTLTGFFGNYENILVTNEFALVEPFKIEFDRIWETLTTVQTSL